ncbi:hypothetical protein BGZ81_000999 [Podila clonocystis]|nr:hypothetical protein BGZ81_000999 [Podila clonocystis]
MVLGRAEDNLELRLFHMVQKEQDAASIVFTKTTVLEPYHPASLIWIGKNYIESGSLKMAESILVRKAMGCRVK